MHYSFYIIPLLHGITKARSAEAIAVVEHNPLVVVREDVAVIHHLRVPAVN